MNWVFFFANYCFLFFSPYLIVYSGMICCYIQADVSHRIDSRLKRCRGTFPVCLRVSGFCWLKLALGTVYWMTRARWRPLLPVGVTGPEWRRPASMFWFRELLCRLIGVVSWFFSWFYCFDSETHHRKMGVFHRAPGTGINSEFISPPPTCRSDQVYWSEISPAANSFDFNGLFLHGNGDVLHPSTLNTNSDEHGPSSRNPCFHLWPYFLWGGNSGGALNSGANWAGGVGWGGWCRWDQPLRLSRFDFIFLKLGLKGRANPRLCSSGATNENKRTGFQNNLVIFENGKERNLALRCHHVAIRCKLRTKRVLLMLFFILKS